MQASGLALDTTNLTATGSGLGPTNETALWGAGVADAGWTAAPVDGGVGAPSQAAARPAWWATATLAALLFCAL